MLRQGLVGSNVYTLRRVQLVTWGRKWVTCHLTTREIAIRMSRLQLLLTDCGHLTSSTGHRAGEEVCLSPLVPDWLVI